MSENNVNSTEEIVLSVEMGDAVSAQTAEAYAVGKRGGVDVAETDPTWHNNAKYYAEQAEEAAGEAQGAEEAAQRAETAQAAAEAARDRAEAIGAGAAQSAAAAAESAQAAATAKTGAETAQSAAAGSATAAEGAAGRASQSATAAAGSATAAGTAKTAAETARDAAAGSATAAAGSATAADQSAQAAAASAQAAEDVAESIPADYSQLSADVTGLKSAIDDAPSEETGLDLLALEQRKTEVLGIVLDEVDTLIQNLPSDEMGLEIRDKLADTNGWLDMIYNEMVLREAV